jgi:hypothetical protein
MPSIFLILLQLLGLAAIVASCTTTNDRYGVEQAYLGYVPARIAIFTCRPLPAGLRPVDAPLSNIDQAAETDICKNFDETVREGFSNQPYMRGYSSNYVQKVLTAANAQNLLGDLPFQWKLEEGFCNSCRTVARSYRETISDRAPWRQWLTDLSQKVKGADSILLPYLVYGYQRTYSDRGLELSERGAGIALLLIDTASGNLLWSGSRESVVPVPGRDFPDWSRVKDRLFIPALWNEFPGRIEQ